MKVVTGTLISSPELLYYFRYHLKSKIVLERRNLSQSKFEQKMEGNGKQVGHE